MHHLRQKWFMWNAIMHRGILLRECFLLCIKWLNFCALYLQIESGGNREQSDHTTSSGNTKKKSNQLPVHVRISLDKAHMLIFLLVMLRTANTKQFQRKKVAELRQRGFSWEENKITEIVHLPSFVCFWVFSFLLIIGFERLWKSVEDKDNTWRQCIQNTSYLLNTGEATLNHKQIYLLPNSQLP